MDSSPSDVWDLEVASLLALYLLVVSFPLSVVVYRVTRVLSIFLVDFDVNRLRIMIYFKRYTNGTVIALWLQFNSSGGAGKLLMDCAVCNAALSRDE